MMNRLTAWCLLIFAVACLSACSRDQGAEYLDNYLSRLSNVLDVDLQTLPRNTENESYAYYHWGFSGEFKSEPITNQSGSGQTISILDFLSLYGCDLQMVVAEGNSNLGKFAPPSQVLLRHLRFLYHTPACLAQLDAVNDAELITQLRAEQASKIQLLPELIWRVILNEDEARQFWRKPATLAQYPEDVGIAPELAIKRLNYLSTQWQSGQYLEGVNELERLLGEFRLGDGGALLSAFEVLQSKLATANALLVAYVEREDCTQGRAVIDLNILRNVVEKYFVGEVQVWAADLNRRVYSLIESYQNLEASFRDVESETYRAWRQQRDTFLAGGLEAIAQHVKGIQQALNHCAPESIALRKKELLPGASARVKSAKPQTSSPRVD